MKLPASRSALRPFDLFEAFRIAKRPLSLSEMARLADIPLSTCHTVVKSLEQNGFLYFISSREVYPTRRLWDMARQISDNDPITTRLAPTLAALRDATGETVILGIRQGDQAAYLLVIESIQTIRYSSAAGEFKPLHSSSIGKALLGSSSTEQISEWVASHKLNKITTHTITSHQSLLAELEKSRVRGYYTTRGENVADVMAMAAPFRLGSTLFAVALAGPLNRMEKNETNLAQQLVACAATLESRNISYTQPDTP